MFDIVTPEGTNPDDVLRGSETVLPVDRLDRITIELTEEPEEFFLMDIMYDSTVPTRVFLYRDDEEQPITEDVGYPYSYISCHAISLLY